MELLGFTKSTAIKALRNNNNIVEAVNFLIEKEKIKEQLLVKEQLQQSNIQLNIK